MSKATLILFAACVGLSLLSLHLVKQMRAGDATIAELKTQIATLEEQQKKSLPAPVEPAPVSTFQPEPVVAQPAPAPEVVKQVPKAAAVVSSPSGMFRYPGGETPSREDRMRMMREHQERQRQLMQDPDYREAMRIQHRSGMTRMYPGVADELGLTAEETEQLFNLLADQQLRSNDQLQPMWDLEGQDPAAQEQQRKKMQEQWEQIRRKNEAELAAHLGPQKAQAWKDYQATIGPRHQVEQVSNSLASQGMPLSEDANRALVKAMVALNEAERQESANQARANPTGNRALMGVAIGPGVQGIQPSPPSEIYEQMLEQMKKRNQRTMDAISPYLTQQQREAIQRDHDAQIKMQEAQIRMMRAQKNSAQNGGNGTSYTVDGYQSVIVPVQ